MGNHAAQSRRGGGHATGCPVIRQGNGFPLNQNNRNNNRRRGRGNNRGGQGGGGGNQGNRIDSRARGNAPQMLEKYRKMAHDASLNGDRVQTEYYLQFADHYFRVIADMRTKDEPRPRQNDRDNDREQSSSYDEADEFDDFEDAGRRQQPHTRREEAEEPAADEGERVSEGDEVESIDAGDNPFTRDTRGRSPRPRGRGRSQPANDAGSAEAEATSEEPGFDAGILPPSIPREEEAAPRRATRGRRRPRTDDDGEEALEAVS
jgi:hypothetical protein